MKVIITTPYFTEIEEDGDYSPRVEELNYFHHADFKLRDAVSYQDGHADNRVLNYEWLQYITNQNLGEEKISISEDDTKKVYVNDHIRFTYEYEDGIAFFTDGEISSIYLIRGDARHQIPLEWICKELKDLIIDKARKEYENI